MSFGSNIKLGFVGHSDTVDVTSNWKTNPFQLTILGNILYGLGSCDINVLKAYFEKFFFVKHITHRKYFA